ncbi:MAG: penicillin-binding protein 2 [Rhodospirillales bacterium]
MLGDTDRQKLLTRRAALLGGGKFALLSALAGRLYYLQVVEAERYATLADENRISLRLLPPPRGRIVDRFGKPLAINRQNYRVVLISENTHDIDGTLDQLSRMIPLSEGDRRRILREIRRKRSFVPVTVRENLSWEEVAWIEVNTPDLPGIMIDVGQSRYYPHGESVAHVLGYVAAVSEKEASDEPLLQLPGFRIGKSGIEKTHDLALRGASGSLQVEVNAVGRIIRELSRQEGQSGAEIALTVDLGLQNFVSKRLGEESASAVVLDVHNGDILALVSTPAYDPNAFNRGLAADEWKSLITNPRAPLTNKAISGQYPPGSTFKMAVALAALEKGVITPGTHFHCSGSVRLGDAKFHCWKKGGHGTLDLVQAITRSCDVYFYEVAKRTGIDRISAMAKKLGMGQMLKVDLPGELKGLMPTRSWKRTATGTPWQQGETLIAGIGQGFMLATPLQLAVMTARLANGGFAVTPRLTRAVAYSDALAPVSQAEFPGIGVSAQNLNIIRQAMARVVNEPGGTAFRSRIRPEEFAMGGKTGTVQVRRISKAEREQGVRKNEDLPWEVRDHALFVGFAPVDNPRYAVAVVIEHGGGGSKAAAPIARDILLEAQRRKSARPGIGHHTTTAGVSPLPAASPSPSPIHNTNAGGEG